MMDGSGSYWSWFKSENAQDPFRAWYGTNTGFNQSANNVTNKPVPMRIPTGPRIVVSWAQVRFAGTETGAAPATSYNYLLLLGVG
jgi:hypothetical protein